MRKTLLAQDLKVSVLGLGCSSMSHGYGPSERDDQESLRVIHRAVESGITLFDTADVYGPFSNERLLAKGLGGQRHAVSIATKCGLVCEPTGKFSRDGRPEHIKAACHDSLRRLGTDVIDLYQLHRVDPEVPIEETWGAMADLARAGHVRALGVSHGTVTELDRIHSIHPIAAVQYELSVWARHSRDDVLVWARENNVGFLAFAPIGRGYLTGKVDSSTLVEGDSRVRDPRFSPEAMADNEVILRGLRDIAERHGATPAQVAIAWTLAQGDNVVPIPGTKTLRWLDENAAAAELKLTAADLHEIERLPVPRQLMNWDRARTVEDPAG
ncbi:aldo/keto reductase [Prauserella cavernicola]|uniref:Aldo/keto reductase n=1 Tax=Prauserella cavernicola TaxID=2800127 RepID=A0A934QWV8_9PSEU|nr:aldo/keto reductase [Prauserella cavernicola]MBK1787850.1 aldo/keto reductase [Prauserella cavernicola]